MPLGTPGQNVNPLAYADQRLSNVPVIDAPRRPTTEDKKYPMWCEWRVNKNAVSPAVEGEFWKLIRFESNGDATWKQVSINVNTAGVDFLRDQVNAASAPDASGNIDVDGATVANGANPSGIPLETVSSTNTITIQAQLGTAVTPTPGDANDAGFLSVNEDHFTVDATSGMVSIKGGAVTPPASLFDVDFNTAPGVDPVVASATGQVSIFGNSVSNGTNANAPVATHSRAVNQYHIDVQLGAAVAATPADPYDAGLLSLDNQFFTVDGNGFAALQERVQQLPAGTTFNLGMSYSSPTYTVHGSDGTALSATNPAWVVMPSNQTFGEKILFAVTSNYSFDDDSGTSDLTGNLWGTTTAVAWNQDIPFTFYWVINDAGTAITPMIARNPVAVAAPATIGKPSSAIADAEPDFWAIDDGITVGDYDGNPCVATGVFRMRKNDAANDDWTVQALDAGDGFGRTAFARKFIFAINQNGATARYQSSSNGGDTLPTFNSDGYGYMFTSDGFVYIYYNTTNVNNTPAGTGDYRLHVPVQIRDASWYLNLGGMAWTDVSLGAGSKVNGAIHAASLPAQYVTIQSYTNFGVASTIATPATFANGDGNFSFNFRYRGWLTT